MTSVKLKFRPSTSQGKEGALFFQVIHGREVRRIKSKYRIFSEEWDARQGKIHLPLPNSPRYGTVMSILFSVREELQVLEKIILGFEDSSRPFNVRDIVDKCVACSPASGSVFSFIRAQILHKRQMGRIRSSETYQSTLNSFMRFRRYADLTFGMMDSGMIELYEAYLRNQGLSRNTSSFYMRILRTNYRSAVDLGLVRDVHPFKHVYCGIDKTVKRSVSLADIKRIKGLDLSALPLLDYARDMFIFSFCTRDMSFVDMAYLRKTDLANGYITYRRKKTGQLLTVEWTRQMQDILDKYPPNPTRYLLPVILREDGRERNQYQNEMTKINRRLKEVARLACLSVPLSLYYSRHSWASIARRKDIPLSVISEGLGHDSETTTQIYLDSIKSYEVDRANKKILEGL